MSRIEEALAKAVFARSITEKQGKLNKGHGSQTQDSEISILIISRDLRISELVNNLRSLSDAEIITSDNIVLGIRSLFERRPIEIDDYELKFAAVMLDNLCCYYGNAASD